jgi:hypothetical protein
MLQTDCIRGQARSYTPIAPDTACDAITALFASKPAPTDRGMAQVMRLTRAQYRCITQIVHLSQNQL